MSNINNNIQSPCSETKDGNSETASSKSVTESSLNSATKDVHAIKYKMSKAKARCMTYFRSLNSHLQVLSKEDLKGTRIEHGFQRAFISLFDQDADTFTSTMLLNVDHLQKQLDKAEFQEDGSMTAFWGVYDQFQKFINSQVTLDYDSQMTEKYFVEYTRIEVKHFKDTLLQHMGNVKKSFFERARHQRQHDRRVNNRLMQTQESKIDMGKAVHADLVVTESNGTESKEQDDNSRSGNDTDADDAVIRPIYDEEPMAKVHLTAEFNIFAIRQQHTEQPEIINDGRVDQCPTKDHLTRFDMTYIHYTPVSPDYSTASDTESDPSKDPSSDHIPPLSAILPFLSSTDDSLNIEIPDTPPSPTHGTAFTKTTISTQRSPAASGSFRRRVMVLAPGQPIPHGRPYRYYLNGPIHMMIARKRVESLPTHCLVVIHSVDYSSLDHFALGSSSSSETFSDSFADALSDYASSRSSSDHSLLAPSSEEWILAASVPLSSPIPGALSYARADLLLSPKRIRNSQFATDLEGCLKDRFKTFGPRKTNLEMDVDVVKSDGINIDPEIQANIDESIAYADALRDKGIDARVVVEAIDRDEIETCARGSGEVRVNRVTHPVIADDIPEPAQEEGAVEVTNETLGDLVLRFHDHTVEIPVHRVQAIEGTLKLVTLPEILNPLWEMEEMEMEMEMDELEMEEMEMEEIEMEMVMGTKEEIAIT
nr:hypothetical protein [Tanacetum cinerariifolium]